MFNNGSIGFGGNTPQLVPPGTPVGASNGLSVDPVSGDAVLGQDVGAAGDPAVLLSDREMILDNFALLMKFAQGSTDLLRIAALQLLIRQTFGTDQLMTDIRDGSIQLEFFTPALANEIILFAGGSLVSASITLRDAIVKMPTFSLEVANGGLINTVFRNNNGVFELRNSNNQNLLVANLTSGNVGIGTSGTPVTKFNVFGTGAIASFNSSANNTIPTGLEGGNPATAYIIQQGGNYGLAVLRATANNGTAHLVIAKNRNANPATNTPIIAGENIGDIIWQAVATDNLYHPAATINVAVVSVLAAGLQGRMDLQVVDSGGTNRNVINLLGINSGFAGNLTPTAFIHPSAGTAAVGTAPFKYTAGVLAQTVVENGAKNFDGTNESIAVGGVTYTMAKTLTATAALDFPNTAAGTSSDLTIALTGAADGDVVVLGVPIASQVANGCYTSFVSAANTITVRFSNNDLLLPFDPASGTFRVSIIKY